MSSDTELHERLVRGQWAAGRGGVMPAGREEASDSSASAPRPAREAHGAPAAYGNADKLLFK